MQVEILRYRSDADWLRCKKLALGTVERLRYSSTDEWKRKDFKVRT